MLHVSCIQHYKTAGDLLPWDAEVFIKFSSLLRCFKTCTEWDVTATERTSTPRQDGYDLWATGKTLKWRHESTMRPSKRPLLCSALDENEGRDAAREPPRAPPKRSELCGVQKEPRKGWTGYTWVFQCHVYTVMKTQQKKFKKKIFFKQNCLRTKMKKQTLLPEKGKQITQFFLGFFIKLEGIWKPTWTSQIQIAFVL